MQELYRIIDANINRACEGMRVVEEVARFIIGDEELARKIKESRHRISHGANLFPQKPDEFIIYRDVEGDVGAELSVPTEKTRDDYRQVIFANIKRVQQATRVIEEFGKIISPQAAEVFKAARYQSYILEKEMIALFQPKPLNINLYVITGEKFALGRPIPQIVSAAIQGGAQVIQLREKGWSDNKLITIGKEIRNITRSKGILFIVNDRVDIARVLDADGVHLGQDDMPIQEARKILGPGKIIGLSTHSYEQAMQAQEMNVDYIGVGPVFPTNSKINPSPVVGLELVKKVSKMIKIPFVAIGGINKLNAAEVLQAGASNIAVISAVMSASNVTKATKELTDIISRERRQRLNK